MENVIIYKYLMNFFILFLQLQFVMIEKYQWVNRRYKVVKNIILKKLNLKL